jgi:hypothetical protein
MDGRKEEKKETWEEINEDSFCFIGFEVLTVETMRSTVFRV